MTEPNREAVEAVLLDVLKDIEKYADVWLRVSQQQAFGDIALRALSGRSVPR